jgi:hypothetical protein
MFCRIYISIIFGLITTLVTTSCSALNSAPASKPVVVIVSPPSGTQFIEGDDVTVQSTATDPTGIVRVELLVNGAIITTDSPPVAQGQSSFSVAQKWKATPGNHTIIVRAANAGGITSNPAGISISVLPATALAPTPTPTLPAPTSTVASELPTLTPEPTLTPTNVPITVAATLCPKPQIASFTINPNEIKRGDAATLSWGAVTNANTAIIDNGVGGVPAPGSRQVRPDKNTTYTLTANGCGGTTTAQTSISVFAIGPLNAGIPSGSQGWQAKEQFNWSNRSGYDGDKYLSNIEIEIERNGTFQPFETTLNFELPGNGYENKKLFPAGKYKIRFRWWMSDRVTHQRVSFKSAWSVICFDYKSNEPCR